MKSPQTVKITWAFVNSFVIAISITGIASVILTSIFRPFRYSGKVNEIKEELSSSDNYNVPFYSYDSGIVYSDANGTKLPDSLQHEKQYSDFKKGIEIERKEWYEKKKHPVFGGTKEFFSFCENANEVTWNVTDITGSILQRKTYLLKKIEMILLFLLPTAFVVSYLVISITTHKIKILLSK